MIFDHPNRYEWGYRPISLSTENIKKYAGCRIVYLLRSRVDKSRGYASCNYTTIGRKRYSSLISADGNDDVDLREVIEAGIHLEDWANVENKKKLK